MCVEYVAYYVRFDPFVEMREKGWAGEDCDMFIKHIINDVTKNDIKKNI